VSPTDFVELMTGTPVFPHRSIKATAGRSPNSALREAAWSLAYKDVGLALAAGGDAKPAVCRWRACSATAFLQAARLRRRGAETCRPWPGVCGGAALAFCPEPSDYSARLPTF